MKRFLSLILVVLTTASASLAQGRNLSMLRLRLSDQSIISVNLDGRFISRGTTLLTLDGIRPGLHRVEVYSEVGWRRRPIRMYTGTLRLQPGTLNTGVVDVYNRGLRLRTRPLDDQDYADDNSGDNKEQHQYPKSNNGNYESEGRRDDDKGSDDVYNNGDRGNADNDRGNEGYGSFPRGRSDDVAAASEGSFSQGDMDDLRGRVASRITDSDKEKLMKTAVDGRTIASIQVREMLGWLSFDDTKLDFAKWAYSSVSDRQNYWKLEDAFSFSATKDDFNKSIRNR